MAPQTLEIAGKFEGDENFKKITGLGWNIQVNFMYI